MAQQFAGNVGRLSWFTGVNWLLGRAASAQGAKRPEFTPTRPTPTRDEIFSDLRALMLRDAEAVRDGLFPPVPLLEGWPRHLSRLRAMFEDLPANIARRQEKDTSTAKNAPVADGLPDYFTQDFHYQTGGYLSDGSARIYDVQVDTLFYGATGPMRRAGLRPIADYMRGRDQRQISMFDVACGTGRFLRDVRLSYPAANLTGLDLSQPYLHEAEKHLSGLRPVTWLNANAEQIPLPDASQDIVSTIFLFHELPPDVRRTVTNEMARVLKPDGLLVFIDSLQFGDKPNWDGMLEAFPVRFHEPYYRQYAIDDLDAMFSQAGLAPVSTDLVFLSKVMARKKA